MVEVIGTCPPAASCILFFLLPETADGQAKSATGNANPVERKEQHPVEWDAPTKETGGTEYTCVLDLFSNSKKRVTSSGYFW